MSDPDRGTLDDLRRLMAHLRGPDGCAWDRALELDTLLPYVTEEAEEVVEAGRRVQAGELPPSELREELGDLLVNVVFTAQLAEELGWFDLDEVVTKAAEKIRRRHPHVFGDRATKDIDRIHEIWAEVKAEERAAKAVELERWRRSRGSAEAAGGE